VVSLSFLLLMIVFRSILVPLKAALLNLLSIGAAYGVVVAVFQWGWGRSLIGLDEAVPIASFVPMMMFAILFGLSMDYEVFILSRIREEYHRGLSNIDSVVEGLGATAKVITAAALIMISVFLGFVASDDPVVKMMGVGLATAVAVDATIVRMVLVPSTMALVGDPTGGCHALARPILPHLDKLGMRASDTAELSFDDVRVPVANTIGEAGRGFQQQMAQFQNERMIAAYQMVGATELALERTVAYLRERQAFGAPLMANQALQYELADLAADLDLVRHHNWAAVAAYLNGEDITRQATVAKLKAARLARRMADLAVQFHGGMGYVEENWPARFFRDTRLWSIGGGADEVMLRTLARMNGIVGD
jgi:hypothetical protein